MTRTKFLFLVCATAYYLAVTATAVQAQIIEGGASASPVFINNNSVDGTWQLNQGESDDVMQKVQSVLMTAGGDEKVDPQHAALPVLSISLFPPETLVVASGAVNETTINKGFRDVMQTRTLRSDGATCAYELPQGASFSVTAFGKGDQLTIVTVSPRGNRMIETYGAADGGRQLKVSIRIESSTSQELLTLHRVYDRLTAVIPAAEEVY